MKDTQIRQWLRDFGYHRTILSDGIDGELVATVDDSLLTHMVRNAQLFMKLRVDGIVGPKTTAAMLQPRCGCADHPRRVTHSRRVPAFGEACRVVGVYADWSGIQGVSPAIANEMLVENFRFLEPYNLSMKMVPDPRDALIAIRMGKASEGVLAWMEVHDACRPHACLFNIDVNWGNEHLFFGTQTHEVIGHGAGVGHSKSIGSVMDPRYDPDVGNHVDPWFSVELDKRYGSVDTGLVVPKPPPVPIPNPFPPTQEDSPVDFATIFATIILPMILECLENAATDEQMARTIAAPTRFQQRFILFGIRQHLIANTDLSRRQRRRAANKAMPLLLARGKNATAGEVNDLLKAARTMQRLGA